MNDCFCPFPRDVLSSDSITSLPKRLAFPLPIVPHGLCRWTADVTLADAFQKKSWATELAKGKMMGVLIVRKTRRDGIDEIGYLKAFSGQIEGKSDWEGYVPAVFDYLAEDGYFKINERKIDAINDEIRLIESADDFKRLENEIAESREKSEKLLEKMLSESKNNKQNRDRQRQMNPDDAALAARLVRESQFEKAEIRRMRKRIEAEKAALSTSLDDYKKRISQLKRQRKQSSDDLQRWLFRQFVLTNWRGERQNVIDIFQQTAGCMPPAGTGECCAPKLLNYAFVNDLVPLAMAEFWVGEAKGGEVRRHGQFYEPCQAKCRPLMKWMLPDSPTDSDDYKPTRPIKIIFADDDIIVVDKPSGMLSVEGKEQLPNVERQLREMFPADGELKLAHRLDQDTAGIIVAARNSRAYRCLQEQFAEHEIEKTYEAIVDGKTPEKGTVLLPIRPDYVSRPRQIVDLEKGKPSVTHYVKQSETTADGIILTRLLLYPTTGRTHQLRVHCAHHDGLSAPIHGDRLYGTPSDRLLLKAISITLRHPSTGKSVTFSAESEF